jgi:tetratricopeptide (TPR) repeat protein
MRRARLRIFATALLLAVAAPADQVSRWSRLSSGSISVYTEEDPALAVPLLRAFSQLRAILADTSAFPINQSAALKVIAFRSEAEFNPYRLNAASCAFYQQTHRSEYIVLQDLAPDHREVAAHEFTHFLLAHSGVNLPLWLNEGLADFYSTFELSASQVTLGRSVAGRLQILRSYAALPLDSLFQISTASSYYSDPDQMALFYSESWALSHMLLISNIYAPHFPDFVNALKQGRTSADSARIAFGRTLPQMQQDLARYLDQQHLPLMYVQIRSALNDAPMYMAAASRTEMDVTLGDLIPSGSSASEESLGYRALENGRNEEARMHFQRAVDHQSDDPNVLFYLAHLDHEAGVPASKVLPLLDRALALKPDMPDARLELALLAANDGDCARALAALQKLTNPRPENAYAAVYTEAFCLAHLDRLSDARAAAERARSLARNDRDRAQVRELLDYIAQK